MDTNEFLHYVFGTILIIFGGHELSMYLGLEQYALENGLIGMSVLFVYYLVVYIVVDQTLHKVFELG